ncbi:DNA methylase [Methanosarcina sp. 2.H.T.1A.6]|nr:DNA methylase [Methanosarcina sp. 2.H.T.1A.15]KKG16001.1 DNA methylase [Methanosarcina sp. 2.H.T.1A.3]KKG21023.1 DNA methylase [Methanosarcina sp. 2.H.T.1A.8]KKG21280.1 DNA methylase [Methanosarcina sp. 2.H.T.1A.6]
MVPFSLKDAPALIEQVLPAQRLSAESYKEQMAGSGKTLTALGSYWKGRKPLILSKACVLGCLLPATDDLVKDLEIFEMLMGMDEESFEKRLKLKKGEHVPAQPYRSLVGAAKRPEEIYDAVHTHIWPKVNAHLGTSANSFPELVEQLGIMRFSHRPKVADTFCGSGQIPFEAARLGCDVYASDLNPIACMLTWGAFHIVGGSSAERKKLKETQKELIERVKSEIDQLGIESDGTGWRAKTFLYCVEVKCPQTGWTVPLLPSFVVSKGYKVIVELIPDVERRRYDIEIHSNVSDAKLTTAGEGTVRTDGRGQDPYLVHTVNGIEYRTKISTLRGDYCKDGGSNGNRLRLWEKTDFMPHEGDLYQERLYAVQWMRPKAKGSGEEYEFRSVTTDDIHREHTVQEYVAKHFSEWQEKGLVPDMRIEPGYNTDQPIRERGWTYWHHLFNPRQLLVIGLINKSNRAADKFLAASLADLSSRLCRWNGSGTKGAGGNTSNTFDNQALNTLFTYGNRGLSNCYSVLQPNLKLFHLDEDIETNIEAVSAANIQFRADMFITDPPYGDAVKYEEILEFFIAWLRKNPPSEFANWVWDSRRALAIKGEDEDFRRSMVSAYKRMAECMPDNGIQVIMFTHQSNSIWADMANIVWASGLQVTAAWYVATETESALRDGRYVKGTVLLVVRKRMGSLRTTRDDLAWDIKDEVESQVATLTGLNQQVKHRYREENLFGDADIQMAGYAAALRVLTQYSVIDGKEMAIEAIRPRVKGQQTFIDELIGFAVDLANQSLVPQGINKAHWEKLKPAERFYLKLLELESQGVKTLDNYQNFAKAFKVVDFKPLMASQKANSSCLKSAVELGRTEMNDTSQMGNTPLRAVLYAIMELTKGMDGSDVLAHLGFNVEGFYDPTVRELIVDLAEYIAGKLTEMRPEEASAARVLRELIKNQKM